jgi:hypothetical protein
VLLASSSSEYGIVTTIELSLVVSAVTVAAAVPFAANAVPQKEMREIRAKTRTSAL